MASTCMKQSLNSNTLIIITGASRGIGQACAIAFANHYSNNLPNNHGEKNEESVKICLLARSKEGLDQTTQLINKSKRIEVIPTQEGENDIDNTLVSGNQKATLDVVSYTVDLSCLDTLEGSISNIFQELSTLPSTDISKQDSNQSSNNNDNDGKYTRAILINNAGSVGPLGPTSPLSLSELKNSIDLNVTSSIWMSSTFLQYFGKHKICQRDPTDKAETIMTKCTVVNVSSLCAIEPFPTMGTYCAGKAARDMFHKVMAKEEQTKDDATVDKNDGVVLGEQNVEQEENNNDAASTSRKNKSIKILNYAPGAIDTDMVNTLSQSEELDDGLSDFFNKKEELLKPMDTAERLVKLIMKDEFIGNGEHIDYWDLEEVKEEK